MSEFLGAPEYEKNHENLFRKTLRVLAGVMQGKTNNTDDLTLSTGSTTTTVTLAQGRLGVDTVILFMPTTANAAAASSAMYVSSRNVENGTFTVTHASSLQTDRAFRYVLIG